VKLLTFDLLASIEARLINPPAPLGALDALAVDDRRRRTRLAARMLAAADVKSMMQPDQRAVMLSAAEIVIDQAPSTWLLAVL